MAEKNIKSRIQHKHDIESNWEKATNFIPKEGEIIIYDPVDGIMEYPRIKIGNGSHTVKMLPFIAAEQSNILSNIGDITNWTPSAVKSKLGSINAFAVGYFNSDENGHCPVLIVTYPDIEDSLFSPKEIYQIIWKESNTYYRIGNIHDNEWSEWIGSLPTLVDLGINATTEEINYLKGTKSNIQTQINNLSTEIDAIDWFKKGESIPENSDLDNYKTPGKYYVNSGSISTTLSNCPVNNDNFVLYVFSRTSSDTSSLGQMIITLGSFIYLRNTSSNNQWRTWYKMAKYDEMTSYADSVGEQIKNDLLNGAGAAYDTLKELADLIVENDDAIEALNKLIDERTIIAGKGLTGGGNLSANRTLNIGAGAGISVNDDDISLTASGVTAGTYGPSLNVSGVHNATMNIPEITVDEYGRVTNIVNRVYTAIDNNTTYSEASTSTSGLMSAADKTKLNDIEAGAEVNQNAFGKITVGSTTITADEKVDTLTLVGSNVTITPDATNDKITVEITQDNVIDALGYTPPTTDTTYNNATVTMSGLMSTIDKEKLDNIATNANRVDFISSLEFGTQIGTIVINDEPTNLYAPEDTRVSQVDMSQTSGEYPIILSKTTSMSKIAGPVGKTSTLTYNPFTNTLTTNMFKGGLNTNGSNIILTNSNNYSNTLPSTGEEGELYFVEDKSLPLPAGGTNGQILVKNSSIDGDASWKDFNESFSGNDYAEYRICNENFIPGQVVCENGDDTLSISAQRLQAGANIVSDTFGFIMGQTDMAKCPIAISGRVLAYTYEPRETFKAGDAVCAAPGGTVSRMTREEIREYPERIIGTVSAIPNYEEWGNNNIKVNNRIWIKI